MNKTRIKWIVLVFIGFLSFGLIIHTPVNQLLRMVTLPDNLNIQQLSGTIAKATIGQLSYQGYYLTDVEVKFSASCLVSLTVCYSIRSDDYALNAHTSFNPLSLSFSLIDSQATVDSQFFDQFSKLIIKPKGEFFINVQNVSIQSQKITNIRIQINWLNAGIEGEEQLLGDYVLDIFSQDDALKMVLGDKQSLLAASGSIDVFQDGTYKTDINLESQSGLNSSIKNALTMFVKPAGLGKYRFTNKGQLSNNNKKLLQYIDMSKAEG